MFDSFLRVVQQDDGSIAALSGSSLLLNSVATNSSLQNHPRYCKTSSQRRISRHRIK